MFIFKYDNHSRFWRRLTSGTFVYCPPIPPIPDRRKSSTDPHTNAYEDEAILACREVPVILEDN